MNNETKQSFLDHELDINKYLNKAIRNYKFIIGFSIITALIAVALTFVISKKYISQATLANSSFFEYMSSQQPNNGLNIGSLASIIPGNSTSDQEIMKTVQIAQSRDFVLNFIEKYKIKSLIDFKESSMNDLVYIEFLDFLDISLDDDTNLVTISFKDKSPKQAATILNQYIEEINYYFAQKDIAFANEIIPALLEERALAKSVDLKEILDGFIFKYVRKKTLAEIGNEYVFEIIDKPFSPDRHYYPRKSVFGILGLLFGAVISFFYVIIFFREK